MVGNSINPETVLPSPKGMVLAPDTETVYNQINKLIINKMNFWHVPTGEPSSIHLRCYASCEGIAIPCDACLEYEYLKTRRTIPGLIEVPKCQ